MKSSFICVTAIIFYYDDICVIANVSSKPDVVTLKILPFEKKFYCRLIHAGSQ